MSYKVLEKVERNCNTCHYNFGDVCAAAYYGVNPVQILMDKKNFPCPDYKIAFDLYMELAAKGKIKMSKDF